MAVTHYKISVLEYQDCPIKYDDIDVVLNILKCWRNNHTTANACSKCSNVLHFELNFKLCCDNLYFKPVNEYIVQSLAVYTPGHSFLPKSLKDNLKKMKIKINQDFLILPDPIYWQISSTLIYERALKYAFEQKNGKRSKKQKIVVERKKNSQEDIYMYGKVQSAFLNHGSLNQRSEGKNTFFRKIALAKRSELTIRAMIVPAPFLKPNEIIIPEIMESKLKLKGKWLIVNRMPSLLPENFLALKVVNHWPHDCFGIPLEVVGQMNADFDGDEINGYVVHNAQSQAECEVILNSECNMQSYTMGIKLSPSHDMLVVYYLKYDEINFLPYKNRDLHQTLKVIYDLYGSKVCFDSIVKLKEYYLNVMQNEILYAITYKEIQDLENLARGLTYEEFENAVKDKNMGCLTTQILAKAKGTYYHLYQLVGSVGLQYAKNTIITLDNNIKSSFMQGLNPVELVVHAQAGIDALISSSGISSVGYIYFKLINNLHNWMVNYKGELVDGDTIIEEDILNILHFEDMLSKPSFEELIRKYLINES